jgi:hypothetical protein
MLTENDIYNAVLRALRDFDKAKEKVRGCQDSLRHSEASGDVMEAMSEELAKAQRELANIGD